MVIVLLLFNQNYSSKKVKNVRYSALKRVGGDVRGGIGCILD